jgi:hypothetical protein
MSEVTHRRSAALVHGCVTPSATELIADVKVYSLMKLLGHKAIVTAQRYVDGLAP